MTRQTVSARLAAEVGSRGLEPDAAQSDAARRLDALGDALRTRRPGGFMRLRPRRAAVRGLYLWGGVGRGKTMLMDFFVATLAGASQNGERVCAERVHFYHFMRDVHSGLADIKQRENPLDVVAARLAARVRVICLDEFFVADIADAMILAALFEGLFKRGVTLVATSNVPPQGLYKDGLQRRRFLPAIELLQTHVDVVHLDGGVDYRLRQLARAPNYLDSNKPDAASALAQRFADIAGGDARGPAELTIEGRVVHALATAPGIAWFDFAELCSGPRSQNDYIELARLHHTLVIAGIPVFDAFNENAARRFIMLIDELYDRGVKIVVSAAASPDLLYRGERLQFEFERAASRLMEMQTRQYLAGDHRPGIISA